MTRSEDEDIISHQLAIVFIRSQHKGLYALRASFRSQCSNDIISLKTIYLQDWNAVSLQQVLDDWHCLTDILRRLFSLSLIFRKSLTTERRPMGIEGHANMCRLLFCEHFIQRVQKAHDGTRIKTFRVDSRVFYERIITAINERISV